MPPFARVLRAVILLSAPLAGCGEITRPEAPVALAVTADPGPVLIEDLGDGPRITCGVTFDLSVSGTGTATIQRAVFSFYMGMDTVAAVDSMVLVGGELEELWGNDVLAPGDAKSSDWHFWAGVPFRLGLVVHYAQQGTGRMDTARTQFACGDVAPAGTAPPVITEAVLDPQWSEYEVGDTVGIRYTATSTAGIWRSAISITGAFEHQQVFTDRGLRSIGRSVRVVVPPGARAGVPLYVTVHAEDVGLQVSVRELPATARVVDVTPPTLTSLALHDDSWLHQRQFAVGDEIRLVAGARDDNALAWLVYEVGAPANQRDSVPISPGTASTDGWMAVMTARAEWLGASLVSAYVRDAAGHRSEVLDIGELRVYPLVERTTSPVLDVPTGFATAIEDVAYDAGRDLMYLAQPGIRSVQRLVVGPMVFDTPIAFDERIGGVDLSLSADSLLVALPESRRIAILHAQGDERTDVALTALDTAGPDGMEPLPVSVRVTNTGRALIPLSHGTRGDVHVLELDLATGVHRLRPDAGVRGFISSQASARFGLAPDRSRLIMLPASACAQVYVAASDSFTPCSPLIEGYPELSIMSFDAAGTRLTFANSILDSSFHEVRRVPSMFMPPAPITLSPGGEVVYVPKGRGIDVMRVTDGIYLERILLPLAVSRLFVAPDGSWAIAFEDSAEPKLVRVSLQ